MARKINGSQISSMKFGSFLFLAAITVPLFVHPAAARAGPIQLPNLLSGYAVRPPWFVAGVDYAVGPQPGVTLKDPTTINMAGLVLDSTHRWVMITGNGVTLDGYDFTLR